MGSFSAVITSRCLFSLRISAQENPLHSLSTQQSITIVTSFALSFFLLLLFFFLMRDVSVVLDFQFLVGCGGGCLLCCVSLVFAACMFVIV